MLKQGVWYGQITVDLNTGDTEVKNLPLKHPDGRPMTAKDTPRAKARAVVAKLSALAGKQKFDPTRPIAVAGGGMTIDSFLDNWCSSRLKRGLRSVGKDRQRIEDHVLPLLTGKPMRFITPEDIKAVVKALDDRIADATVKFSWKTADNTWRALKKLFKDASGGKDPTLCIVKTDPCLGVEGPDRGDKKVKQWLYPNEFAAFVETPEVPIEWRRWAALATYLLLRIGELRALHCEDIDLKTGMIRIHRSRHPDTDELRELTKTGSVREFRIEPELLPLVAHLVAERGGRGPLVTMSKAQADKASGRLRHYLKRAMVRRDALHRSTSQAINLTFHDLRGTGITWSALRGDAPFLIRNRAGHQDVKMTDHYVSRAAGAGDVGKPFPSLRALYPSTGKLISITGPTVHSTRDSTRQTECDEVSLASTGTYEVEPRGIESLSGAPTTGKSGKNEPAPCPNCAGEVRPRNIPRDILTGETRGPTVQQPASVWALALAAERLLARFEVEPTRRPPGASKRVVASYTTEPDATVGAFEEPVRVG